MSLKLLETIHQQIDRGLYHGASLALFQSGKWQEYYIGTVDGKQKVREDMVYDLASVSKVIGVATMCIFLVNSGALHLDFPLKYYYPAVVNEMVTLRQLLTHTSGLDPYIPNRDNLNAEQLKQALNQLTQKEDQSFHYTDVNFLLLGFMLEELFGQSLDHLFKERIFTPFGMSQTSFGPRREALPTRRGISDGQVHNPKARVLKEHAGSAGLFSTLKDLQLFLEHYLEDDFSDSLFRDYSGTAKSRSLGWNLERDWIDHTGYTGPFIMLNKNEGQAAIFLTNRTFETDDRPLWIAERRLIRDAILESFTKTKQEGLDKTV
ncbi:serine hydrolase domain-containing protein [Streptococcus ictaluri]|uniref:Beta-lactamase n=1 Tax=Streptococcus ictaluri 707-05 TaxID=764299 RepID=G5JZT7_9STRE|nr:serine hydrolase domain-containing protein [Streptococcus ictaluri]EHI70897.1 beta-lactamase [Streptococcus ictaluri 707-05]